MTLYKKIVGLVLSGLLSFGNAQTAPLADSPAPEGAAQARVEPATALLGLIKQQTSAAEKASDFCSVDTGARIPKGSIVVVVRHVSCVSRYGASLNKQFLEVLYAGQPRLVRIDSVHMTDADTKQLGLLQPAQIEASMDDWRRTSLLARSRELQEAIKALDATRKHGIAVLDSGVYDVSEHTEGTGFRISVYNPTKKAIKYVTVSLVGLNAVGDPVRGPLRNTTIATLRGIGPIDPDDSASYSKDYMWMTDIVEDFRISSIKVEYMDGSSKTVTNLKGVSLSEEARQVLESASD